MLRIFFFTLILIINFPVYSRTLLFLGDSLTEGLGVAQELSFPFLIQKKSKIIENSWTIISSGSSGSTTASTLSRMKWLCSQKPKPDLIFILMGSNDALRGLDIKETEKNLEGSLQWAQENKIDVILGQMHAPPNYGKKYFNQFSDVFPRLSKKFKIPLAPYILKNVAGVASLNQKDGIHPNEKGHEIIAEDVYKFLQKEFKLK